MEWKETLGLYVHRFKGILFIAQHYSASSLSFSFSLCLSLVNWYLKAAAQGLTLFLFACLLYLYRKHLGLCLYSSPDLESVSFSLLFLR